MKLLATLICLFSSGLLFAQRNGTVYFHLAIPDYVYQHDFKVVSLTTKEVISDGHAWFSPNRNFVDSIIVEHPLGITDTFFVKLKHRRDYYSFDLKPTQALLDEKAAIELRRKENLDRIVQCPEPIDSVIKGLMNEPKENVTYEIVEVQAEYPGGVEAMKRDLANSVRFPEIALEMGINGKVYMKFVINKEGNIQCARIIKGIPDCPECDQEALIGLSCLKQFIPAMNDGVPVNSYYILPLTFRTQ